MNDGYGKEQRGWRKALRFAAPIVIAASVTLLAFFLLQGIPLAQTLSRRTDLVSALVTQNGEQKLLMDQEEIVRAAEVAGMLARRFPAKEEGDPDTWYEFTFRDGSVLTVGVLGDRVLYNGKWYTGAASTPDLFRRLTGSRFFSIPAEELPEGDGSAQP